jgi:hypothetical protein
MAKHFALAITDDRFRFARRTGDRRGGGAGRAGRRAHQPAAETPDLGTVRADKSLAVVERRSAP